MMRRTCACIAVFGLIFSLGIVLAQLFPLDQKPKDSSVFSDQAVSFESLFPDGFDLPVAVSAEFALPFASEVLPPPAIVQALDVQEFFAVSAEKQSVPELAMQQLLDIPQSLSIALEESNELSAFDTTTVPATPSYIYFYTGIPVQPAPTTIIFNTSGFSSVTVAAPVPVFVPQVVPSRVGAPKWVYSNGVVIKPKVYFPNQPVRNTFRAITP